MKLIDLTGKRFGRLIVIKRDFSKDYYTNWLCKCDCGNIVSIIGNNLRSRYTKSCGCYHKEIISIHKMSNVKIHQVWRRIKQRCYNKNHLYYKNYGGRGIKMCDYWLESFENFYKDMGDKPEEMSIDRIDNDGNYTPKNCRWATRIEQQNNTRRNIFYTYKGEKKTLSQLARKYNIHYETLRSRLRTKKSIEEAIEKPTQIRN